jgi:3-hydroxybutyryl-CoA dehydrogenase
MTIVVLAAEEQWKELTANPADIQWIKAEADFLPAHYTVADAFFILQENSPFDFTGTNKPVFINSVIKTLAELNAPANAVRINGWHSFLQRPVWEIAGNITDTITAVAEKLHKKIHVIKDEPGLVSAKIIAMIINEAYFALGDEVSSKTEIDTAMKLGTNYPYGPFEWAQKIGLKNIYALLLKLSLTDKRCQPAPLLVKEATLNNA